MSATFSDLIRAIDEGAVFAVYGGGESKRSPRLRIRIAIPDLDHARALADVTGLPLHPRPASGTRPLTYILEVRSARAAALMDSTLEHLAPATQALFALTLEILDTAHAARQSR